MRRSKRKNLHIKSYIMIVAILSLALGYSIISRTINIGGTANINPKDISVHWENVVVNEESSVQTDIPELSEEDTKVSYEVSLTLPGDFYEFTVDAKNDSTVPIKISDIDHIVYASDGQTEATLPSCIKYTIKYTDKNTAPAINDLLSPGDKQTYKVRIEYDYDSEEQINENTTYIIEDAIHYEQAQNSEIYSLTFEPNGGVVEKTTRFINQGSPIGYLPRVTKEGFAFDGWYTGITDGDRVTEETIPTGNTTYYAHWSKKKTTLDTGPTVNAKIKRLANPSINENQINMEEDTSITSITRTETQPILDDMTEANIISVSGSENPIYAWFDNGTIYWWTEANDVYLNQNSSYLFCNLTALTNFELDKVISDNLTDISYTFVGLKSMNTIDLSKINTESVTNMEATFGLTEFESLDLSKLDTTKVTNMSLMFAVSNLNGVDFTGFNTSSAENMSMMFAQSSATNLNLSSFDVSKVINFTDIFSSANVENINISGWDFTSTESIQGLFNGLTNLKTVNLTNVNTSTIKNMSNMFANCRSLQSINLSSLNTSNVTTFDYMFYYCESLTELNLSGLDTSNVLSYSYMIAYCTSLETLDMSYFDFSKYDQDMLLYRMAGLSQLPALKTLKVDNAVFGTNLQTALAGLPSLETISLKNVDTSKATNMMGMFVEDSGLKTLDLSSFDTTKVTNMSQMFGNCKELTTIYVSDSFDTDQVTNSEGMFTNTIKIVGGHGTAYNANHIDKEYACYDEGTTNPGYFSEKNHVNEYEIILQNGNTVYRKIYVEHGSHLPNLPLLSKPGYTFEGWYTGINDGVKVDNTYIPTSNMTIYARYTEITDTYTITFNGNGAEVSPESKTIIQTTPIGELPAPTKEGFELAGWYTGLTDGIRIDESYIPTEDMLLYAHWVPITVVTYDSNGGVFVNNETTNIIKYKHGSANDVIYSHTSNINDDGIATGTYSPSLSTNDVVTFGGAAGLQIEVWYSTENGCDWLAIYPAGVTPTNSNYDLATISNGRLMGGGSSTKPADDSAYHKVFTVDGDTAQFYFVSDSSVQNYGYYAIITPLVSKDKEYRKPRKTDYYFNGWNTERDGTGTNYSTELDVIDALNSFGLAKTLYAQWELADKYTVTFNANGGEVSESTRTIQEKDSIGILPIPVRDGYQFTGWYTELTDGIKIDEEYIPTANINLYAHWLPIRIVNYNSNNGKFNNNETINTINYEYVAGGLAPRYSHTPNIADDGTANGTYASNLELNDVVTIEGARTITIEVWYSTQGISYDWLAIYPAGVTPTSSNYSQATISNGRLGGGSSTTKPTNQSYHKVYTVEGDTAQFYFKSNASTNYYGYYAIITPNIIIDNEYQEPTREDYIFTGWNTEVNGSGIGYTNEEDILSNITNLDLTTDLYAQWRDAEDYTITFNANGGTVSEPTRVIKETKTIGVLPIPTRENYTFSGWYTGLTDGIKITSEYIPTDSIEIYAGWVPQKTITFDGASGKFNEDATTNTIKYKYTNISTTTKYSHTPNVNDDGTISSTYAPNLDINDIVTIEGAPALKIDVWYSTQGTSYDWLAIYPEGVTPTAENYSEATISNGKLGGGSYTSKPVYESYHKIYTVEGDTAQFYFHSNDSGTYYGYYAVVTPIIYKDNEYQEPTREDYIFTGWNTAVNGTGTAYATEDDIISDLENINLTEILYAQWRNAENYTVTFNANGGTVSESTREVQERKTIGELPEPTRENCIFYGWYTGLTDGIKITPNYIPTSNIELYASWIPTRKVTYNAGPGNFGNNINTNIINYAYQATTNVKYSHTPNIADDGTVSGTYAPKLNLNDVVSIKDAAALNIEVWYSTDGISYDWLAIYPEGVTPTTTNYSQATISNGRLGGGSSTSKPTNESYHKVYRVEGDTVQFYFHSNEANNYYGYYAIVTPVYKQDNTYKIPTREDYIFTEWAKNSDGTGTTYATEDDVINSLEELEQNTTLYAKYRELERYTMTFNYNDGETIPITRQVQEFSSIGELPVPTRNNYIFTGWYTGITDGVQLEPTYIPTDDQEFYAHWIPIKNVTFDSNGGIFSNNETTNIINYTDINVTKYSHTPNIADDGTVSGTYPSNLDTNDVITIPGATTITIEVWFSTQGTSYDWLAIYPAGVTPTTSNYSQATISNGKLGGGSYTSRPTTSSYHRTYTVEGNTAQFYFHSNGSSNYYGYYAVITADYEKDNDYIEPTIENNSFEGWNTERNGSGITYTSESDILEHLSDLDEETTLYAKWHEFERYEVTFDANGGDVTPYMKYATETKPIGILPIPTREGYTFVGWYTGLTNGTYVPESYVVTEDTTLYARWMTNKTIIYNANGGLFKDLDDITNTITYTTPEGPNIKRYSHTPNISDNGTINGTYPSNLDTNDIVTIPGAQKIKIDVWYSTQGTAYDWLAIYPAGVTPTAENYSEATISGGKLGGGNYTTKPINSYYHKTYTIEGNTAQFYFHSDASSNYYGYYATITPVLTQNNTYRIPKKSGYTFEGWSTSPSGSVDYYTEEYLIENLDLFNNQTMLYAQWSN